MERLGSRFHCLAPDCPASGVATYSLRSRSTRRPICWPSSSKGHVPTGRAHVVGLSYGGSVVFAMLDRCPERIDRAVIDGAAVLPTWGGWGDRLVQLGAIAVSPIVDDRLARSLLRRVGLGELGDLLAALPPLVRRRMAPLAGSQVPPSYLSLHRRSRQNGPPVGDGGAGGTKEEDGMGSEAIREALTGAVEYLSANPAEARSRDGVATATLRDGLVVDVRGQDGEAATTDMVASVGGTGRAPSPGWLLRAAAASCVATLIAMRAAMLDVALETLEVSVDSESDDLGILGIDASVPAGPLSVRVAVSVRASGSDAERLREIVAWGVAHCPVTDTVQRAVPVDVVVDV